MVTFLVCINIGSMLFLYCFVCCVIFYINYGDSMIKTFANCNDFMENMFFP